MSAKNALATLAAGWGAISHRTHDQVPAAAPPESADRILGQPPELPGSGAFSGKAGDGNEGVDRANDQEDGAHRYGSSPSQGSANSSAGAPFQSILRATSSRQSLLGLIPPRRYMPLVNSRTIISPWPSTSTRTKNTSSRLPP